MRDVSYGILVSLSLFLLIKEGWCQNDTGPSIFNSERGRNHLSALGPLTDKHAILNDPLIPKIVQHIQEKYGVHTVILFGSRARGTATDHSDYDIIGLQKSGEEKTYTESFQGANLEIFIFPEKLEENDLAHFFLPSCWQEAVVLHQSQHKGDQFLSDIKKAFFLNQKDYSEKKKNKIRHHISF